MLPVESYGAAPPPVAAQPQTGPTQAEHIARAVRRPEAPPPAAPVAAQPQTGPTPVDVSTPEPTFHSRIRGDSLTQPTPVDVSTPEPTEKQVYDLRQERLNRPAEERPGGIGISPDTAVQPATDPAAVQPPAIATPEAAAGTPLEWGDVARAGEVSEGFAAEAENQNISPEQLFDRLQEAQPGLTIEKFMGMDKFGRENIGGMPTASQHQSRLEEKAKAEADALQSKRDADFDDFQKTSGRFGDIGISSAADRSRTMRRLREPPGFDARQEAARRDQELHDQKMRRGEADIRKVHAESDEIFGGIRGAQSERQMARAQQKFENEVKRWELGHKGQQQVMDSWAAISQLHLDREEIAKSQAERFAAARDQQTQRQLAVSQQQTDWVFKNLEQMGTELEAAWAMDYEDEGGRAEAVKAITDRYAGIVEQHRMMMGSPSKGNKGGGGTEGGGAEGGGAAGGLPAH